MRSRGGGNIFKEKKRSYTSQKKSSLQYFKSRYDLRANQKEKETGREHAKETKKKEQKKLEVGK